MILPNSLLKTSDNSGALVVSCIKIKKQYVKVGKIGSLLVVSIKKLRKNKQKKKLKKGTILLAVLIRTRKEHIRRNNVKFSFFTNSVVLVNKQLKPISTRIIGLLPKELRTDKYMKIISMSSGLL
jgi:large subunit ribosomal protein L14